MKTIGRLVALALTVSLLSCPLTSRLTFGDALENDSEYQLWLSNAILYGLGESDNNLYQNFREMQKPVYKILGEEILNDGSLTAISTTWSVYLNSEYRNKYADLQESIYVIILMDYLKYGSLLKTTASDITGTEFSFAMKLYKSLAKEVQGVVDSYDTLSIEDLQKKYTPEEAGAIWENSNTLSGISEAMTYLNDGKKELKTLVKEISQYYTLQEVKDDTLTLLRASKSSAGNNTDYINAVNHVIGVIESTSLEYIAGRSEEYLWNRFLNTCWGNLMSSCLVLKAVDFSVSAIDACFDTTNSASNNVKLIMLYTVDNYLSVALSDAFQNYYSSPSVDNARIFNDCFESYIHFQMFGGSYAKRWLSDYLEKGIVKEIYNLVLGSANVNNANALLELNDAQIALRSKLLHTINTYREIYQSRNSFSGNSNETVPAYYYGGHKYELSFEGMRWQDAKAACEQRGGHLVTINSEDEQLFLESIIPGHGKQYYWTGLLKVGDYSSESSITWITGEPVTYLHKPRGVRDSIQPNMYICAKEHQYPPNYHTVYLGEWVDHDNTIRNDEFDYTKSGYICEYGEQDSSESEYLVSNDYTSISLNTLPVLDDDDAKTFLRFIYNSSEISDSALETDPYFYLMTGRYDELNLEEDSQIELKIQEFSLFVRTAMNVQVQQAEFRNQYISDRLLSYLERKLSGMTEVDEQIIREYTSKAKELLIDGIFEGLYCSAGHMAGFAVTQDMMDTVNTISSTYSSFLNAPGKAQQFVEDIGAVLEGAVYVLNGEINGRAVYFCDYLNQRQAFSSPSDPVFRTIMDYNRSAIKNNNYQGQFINAIGWIAGKDSWDRHYETIERWAEYLYSLEHKSAFFWNSSGSSDGQQVSSKMRWGDYEYSVKNDSVTILKYLGTRKVVVIPTAINGKIVTAIESNAFSGNVNIETLVMPENIRNVGNSAFSNCTGIVKLTLPVDMAYWENAAFSGCENVTSITYTAGKTGVMPAHVSNHSNEMNQLEYMAREKLKTVVFEEGVKSIAGYAMYSNYGTSYPKAKLTKIVLPSTLEKIGEYAFKDQNQAEFVTEGGLDALTTIGKYAFCNCTKLTVLPANVTIIPDYAFYNCKGLPEKL